jgi:AcrR family transcriptional regulator
MQVDERREQLLELGVDLFARHSFAELSMAQIAREAGISKPLLYHYFPSKRDYFLATLSEGVAQLAERTTPDPAASPMEALSGSVEAFVEWVDQRDLAYRKLLESAGEVPEVKALIDEVRDRTSARIVDGLGFEGAPPPKVRVAVRGWLWLMDGAILDWLEHRDLTRDELRDFLLGALAGALAAAGSAEALNASGQ